MNHKIVLIGCGNVGTSYAYALLNQKTFVKELVLIDINKEKAEGEAMDLSHCLAFSPSKTKIKVGSYKDSKDAKIVCITAGKNQEKGENRLNLIEKNNKIIENIVENVMKYNFQGIFLIATNPVDIMADLTYRLSGLPASQIIGSGTILDTARLRFFIGERLHLNLKNIHAYVIGEHGDSAFIPWSQATIGLNSINTYFKEEELRAISTEVKESAYKIIEKKGFTNFGIGICLAEITKAILENQNSMLTVSSYNKAHDLFISQPAIINYNGIKKTIKLTLNEKENDLFLSSINKLKQYKK